MSFDRCASNCLKTTIGRITHQKKDFISDIHMHLFEIHFTFLQLKRFHCVLETLCSKQFDEPECNEASMM